MASVEIYRDADGQKRYAARWRQDGKQAKVRKDPRTLQPFKSEAAARKYAQDQESLARQKLLPVRSDVTVGEYAAYWLTTRSHRPSTKQRMGYSHKHFEATGLAKRKLVEVKQSQVQTWASDRAQVLAPSTVRRVLVDLSAVFRTALHDGLIRQSPVVNIKLPEADDKEFIPLTVAQVERLADAMLPRYRAMVIVQAGTGLRAGELLGLRIRDIDYLHRRVSVEWQRTRARPQERSPLKTKSSKRTVPLPKRVAEELERHIAAYCTTDDLFLTSTGAALHMSHYVWMVARAARKAGLPEGTTSHDLRHHYATELLGRGLSTVEVGHLLGHKDGSLVETTYGHSRQDATELAQAALDAAWNDEAV